jgi:hypothetical protein
VGTGDPAAIAGARRAAGSAAHRSAGFGARSPFTGTRRWTGPSPSGDSAAVGGGTPLAGTGAAGVRAGPSTGVRRGGVVRSSSGGGSFGYPSHGGGHRTGNVFYRSNHGHHYYDDHHHHHHHHYDDHHHHGSGWSVGFWWDPWYYDAYSPCWIGGYPAFGYGTVVYEPYPVVIDPGVVVVPGPAEVLPPPVVEGVPGTVPPPPPPPADLPAEGEGAPPEGDTPADPAIEAARREFQEALDLFLGGRYEESLYRFRGMTTADAKNGEAWMARAHAAFALGQYAESAESVARAAALGAFPRGYRFDPAPIYRPEGAFSERLGLLITYTREHPDDADAQLVLAWLQVSLGNRAAARAALAGVEGIRPDDATAALLRVALLPPEPPAEGAPATPPAR